MGNNNDHILEVKNLKMHFPITAGLLGRQVASVKAVDGVTFSVNRGEVLGLVGESGCGKTTIGKCILNIYETTDGEIIYEGKNIAHMKKKEFSKIRRDIGLVFQDPLGSLDPRQSVLSILKEAVLLEDKTMSGERLTKRIHELLDYVELNKSLLENYPHEMSRGQRQRIGIARALACNPKLIVCDEPVSALDVSTQAQIINLLRKLQKEIGLTYVFIAHDISAVRHVSDKVAVMYLGKMVELIDADALYHSPKHPYTLALLSAIPLTDYYEEHKRERIVLTGEVPSPINAPTGCTFHPRCQYATDLCKQQAPAFEDIGGGHMVACHMVDSIK